MSDAEAIWRTKTDDEVAHAAAHLDDFTGEGQRIIQAELRRRQMAPPQAPTSCQNDRESPVVSRYRDAYRVATTLVAFGTLLKVVGAVIAAVLAVSGLLAGNGPLGNGALAVGVIVGAINGLLFWVAGVLIAAQGQILRATLDGTVAASPFLTNKERLMAMGLPLDIA